MLSLQEISDRLEIQDLMVAYANAIDRRQFDELDKVFTPDAYIDYRAMGGIDGKFPDVKKWLSEILPSFPMYYHMIGNTSYQFEGDKCSTRIICFNPMIANIPGRGDHVMFYGLWYHDKFIRTPQGWRMFERVEVKCFDYNIPPEFKGAV